MKITEEDLNDMYSFLIGVGMQKAARMISSSLHMRVLIRDGKKLEVDSTYKENRLNVEVTNKIVVRILSVG